jgi:hypothetical protein
MITNPPRHEIHRTKTRQRGRQGTPAQNRAQGLDSSFIDPVTQTNEQGVTESQHISILI